MKTFPAVFLLLLAGGIAEPAIGGDSVTITVLYDNTPLKPGLKAGWGFSCVIEGCGKTILFDAGSSGGILLDNARQLLPFSLTEVPLVVVSHDHGDHTGGLRDALGTHSTATAYFGPSFSAATEQIVRSAGATVVRGTDPVILLPLAQTTAELSGVVNEQALIITVDSGLVVVTGCSHPGIVKVLARVKQLLGKEIYMVLGGFHLLNMADENVRQTIKSLKDMGVKKCGATHCTGERQMALIKQAYGSDYVEMGVGRVISFPTIAVSLKQDAVE